MVDYEINHSIFAWLDRESEWGPHTVDRMASASNARLRRFYSRYFADGAEGIDCFSVQARIT
jgi:hypothetical protein